VDIAITAVNSVAALPAALLYLVIIVWLTVESTAVPIPNEAILLFSGFLIGVGHLNLFVAWAASITGTVGGATVAWWIARTFGPAGVRRVGRYIFLTPGRLGAAEAFFRRRGVATVFIARLTPIIRTVVSYPAGLSGMPYRSFVLATALGCAIWNLIMLLVGRAAGEHWSELFQRYHTPVLLLALLAIVATVGYLVVDHNLKRRIERSVDST